MLCLTGLLLAAQDPFPTPGADPAGVVLDERGRPVAGAAVELRTHTSRAAPFARAIARVLGKAPLPSTVSDKDGEFVLPLLPEQKALVEGEFFLVVEKEGYAPWIEPLGQALAGYLGSRVVLRVRRDGDPFALVPWPPVLREDGSGASWIALRDVPSTLDLSRRGHAPDDAPPAEPGTKSVQITVVVEGGGPVADASILFQDGACYDTPELRRGPARTDREGKLRLSSLPAGSYACTVVAAGFYPGRAAWSFATDRDQQSARVELVPQDLLRLVTVDGAGRAVPFARLQRVTDRKNDRVSDHLLSDSRGRICTPVPRGGAIRLALRGDPRTLEPSEPDAAEVRSVTVPRTVPVLVLTPPIRRLDQLWIRNQPSDWSGDLGFECSSWLVLSTCARAGCEVAFGVAGAAPIRIAGSELPPPSHEPFGLVRLDRTQARRVPLRVRAPAGHGIDDLIVECDDLKGGRARATFNLARREPDGSWSLLVRDDGAWRCRARLGTLRSAAFWIPAREPGAREATIELVLEAGTEGIR